MTTVNRSELVTALRAVRVAAGGTGMLPILANVKIESINNAIFLTTTNLEVYAQRQIGFKGDPLPAVTVPAKAFTDFAGGFSGDNVSLAVDGPKLRLTSGRQKASLNVTDADEFPAFAQLDSAASFTVTREEFDSIVGRVVGFAAKDTARPILTGVQLRGDGNTIRAVAADNYRVGVLTLDHQAEVDIVIPATSLQAAAKVLGGAYVSVTTDGRVVMFSGESGVVISRLIEGQYPNIDPVLPSNFTASILLGQEEFESAAKLAAMAGTVTVKFEQVDDGLRMYASDFDRDFDTTLAVTLSVDAPKDIRFALAPNFVSAIASVFGDSTHVEAGYSGPLQPVDFRDPTDASFRAVVMPVRTS